MLKAAIVPARRRLRQPTRYRSPSALATKHNTQKVSGREICMAMGMVFCASLLAALLSLMYRSKHLFIRKRIFLNRPQGPIVHDSASDHCYVCLLPHKLFASWCCHTPKEVHASSWFSHVFRVKDLCIKYRTFYPEFGSRISM